MHLILHHFRKDVRLLRWWILLWLLAVAVLALPDLLIFQPDYAAARAVDSYRSSPLTMLIGFIAWTVLVARLIQSEPVTGSSSFWLTRPVPRHVYLASKLLFLATLVMLPAFIPGIVHAFVFGADAAEVRAQVVNVLAFQLIGAVGVIWLATYTPNLVYFAGMLCLGAVVLVVENLLISMQPHVYGQHSSGFVPLVVAGLLVSLIVEHFQRGSRLGLSIGLASIALCLLGQYFAPPGASMTMDPSIFRVPKTAQVDFQPDWPGTVTWSDTSYGNGQRVPAAVARLTPMGDSSGNRILINYVVAQFDVPGEFPQPLSGVGPQYFSIGPEQADNTDLVQSRLPGIKLKAEPNAVPAGSMFHVGLFNLLGVENKVRGKTGALTLNVEGQVLELRQVAALPLGDPHYIAHLPGGFLRVRPVFSTQADHLVTLWSVGPAVFPPLQPGQLPLRARRSPNRHGQNAEKLWRIQDVEQFHRGGHA